MLRKILFALIALFAFATAEAATTCVQGASGTPPVATLTFAAPTLNTDGTPITLPLTYTVLMGTSSGAETQLSSGLSGSPVVINTGLKGGGSYYFEVFAVDSNGNGVTSNEVCKSFPASTPAAITITIS